ncbi:MAG TPA: hypothetical protein VK541_15220 [Pedobacter sp.]|uniref:hypothetical protein n=1 Tax=Pedobacter sp. TaxID=1411316 RepID=UPI002C0D1F5B|nr:hypothetical protein [Pedobacter sp.]HMI03834.1 hypothetical protein [Pedobacter sp.]
MIYKLGDFVRFVDENLEGYITRIIDKDTIGVTDANDFEIPVLASKVTLVHGDLPGEDDSIGQPLLITSDAPFVREGVYIGIVADQHSNSVVHFHLINETSFQLLSSLTTEKGGIFKGEFSGITAPHSTKKIYSAQLADIQVWPKFRIEVLFNSPLSIEPGAPLSFRQHIKGKDLSVAKEEISSLKQKGWLFRLDEPSPAIDAEKLKQSFFK